MTQTTKSVKVTFTEGELPGGRHATFKVGKEQWTAWPNSKHAANMTIIDRLIGALSRVRVQCINWLNAWPQDAQRVAAEASAEKGQVWTS